MLDKKAIIIGYSGHSYTVIETAQASGFKVELYSEKKEALHNPFSLKYLGCESDSNFDFNPKTCVFLLGIGNNEIREKTAKVILSKNGILPSVVSPDANVSKYCTIGKGVVIVRGVNLNALTEIGDFSILNTGCCVDHECSIGKSVHIAPGAVLAGQVSIGNGCFIGANSFIKQGVKIGEGSTIGAGSVVLHDVAPFSKIVGNPGKIL